MKKRVIMTITSIVIALMIIGIAGVGIYASKTNSGVAEIFSYWLGTGEMPENADLNDDGNIDVLDAIILIKEYSEKLNLKSITLDDDRYVIDFKSGVKEFTVNLPDGRPSIPQITAVANAGSKVEIAQAYIPDGETEGCAYIKVTSGNESKTYTVKFVRDKSNGFVLQYDDRYEFPLENKTGYTFESNNTDALTVDNNGLMTAKKVTNSAITVTATNGSDTKTLVVDRIEKAHVNLFFITGQSNGQGCYDGVNYDGSAETVYEGQIAYVTQLASVEKIGQQGRVYSYDVHPRSENQNLEKIGDPSLTIPAAYTMYDMQNHAKQGHQASLGKNWYDMTGEKVVFLQSAWSGAPIEAWIDPDRYEEAGGYGIATRNFYKTTKEGYNRLLAVLEENYEIIRKANFWCQGETAMTCYYDKSKSDYIFSNNAGYDVTKLITDAKYYEYFMRLDTDMREDFGLDFNGIMMTKTKGAQTDTTIVPIVSAHFSLANNNDGIFTATRKFIEIARQHTSSDKTSEGYAFMGTDGNHYNQIGYNYHGKEAAENAFGYIFRSVTEEATGVEIIAPDGKTRLTPDDTVEIKSGMTYRLGALSVPRYTSEKITWSSSDENIAKVNEFGVISPISSGTVVIKATSESGASQSFNVKSIVLNIKRVNYRWDFNDLKATDETNELMLSEGASATADNYTISEGIYSTKTGLDYAERPDFTFEKPFMIDSKNDWTIEWRYKAAPDTAVTLMGRSPAAGQTDYVNGRIYIYYAREWGAGSGVYPLNINFEEGNGVSINYGDYRLLNNEMHTWKLRYSKDTKILTLYYFNDETQLWETVGTAKMGEFKNTFTTLFGRQNQQGAMNFCGDVDYIEVDALGYEANEYLWDFNDLTSTGEKNDLTLSPLASNTANNYSLENGIYTTRTGLDYAERPDFTLEKPFSVDSECNWHIEWRADLQDGTACMLMGPTPESADSPTISGNIYLAYSVHFGNGVYPLAFIPTEGKQINLNYGDYRLKNNEMNTWKLDYRKDTKMLSLLLYDEATSNWITVEKKQAGEFSLTVTNLFGRISGGANMNFTGSVDYIRVYTERTE